jgi:hypothetical protein
VAQRIAAHAWLNDLFMAFRRLRTFHAFLTPFLRAGPYREDMAMSRTVRFVMTLCGCLLSAGVGHAQQLVQHPAGGSRDRRGPRRRERAPRSPRDFSNQAFFAARGAARTHQNTALVGLVWWVGNKTGSW